MNEFERLKKQKDHLEEAEAEALRGQMLIPVLDAYKAKVAELTSQLNDFMFDEIRTAAKTILNRCADADKVTEINRFLAELEPYPSWIIRIEEVK